MLKEVIPVIKALKLLKRSNNWQIYKIGSQWRIFENARLNFDEKIIGWNW